ncbi:4-carboxymuconolactone decarboxylase [Gonapodya prolifera JEL478]|uniref:4-carboxymuconolactone decarboxylase n=1 Tax=Gonapodya prolifera (strain JEL478) TaxID=1344416 RepID=A0A139A915_GONPJ|nr:4-carboxymuconolactone decarboxylase [Gonapodya prolifera JEL478]|eukprot:KXS13302.1 4-carboxymuconolactone decarboxylase [Gonapodya prolifera JEL478]
MSNPFTTTSILTPEMVAQGLQVRREVLGDAYVDRTLQNMDEFSRPLQEVATGFAWGQIWTRDGLDRKTRSLLNLAMLSALNRQTEFKTHVRGAFNNGATLAEVQEVLLQVATYAGMPAGVEAFRNAGQVVQEMKAEGRELK